MKYWIRQENLTTPRAILLADIYFTIQNCDNLHYHKNNPPCLLVDINVLPEIQNKIIVKAINFVICIIDWSRRRFASKRLGERIIFSLHEKGFISKTTASEQRMAGR